MEQKERMDQGLIYDPADNRISTEQTSCLDAQYEFNATRPSEMKKRAALLKQMLGAIGENCYIEPPFRANWGGKHTIYPLRVLKQVVSCFASANGPFWCQEHPSIKEFLLNPEERRFPSNIDIRMYMQSNGRSKIDKVSGQMNPFTGEKFVGSEFAYPPFGFICVIDRKMTSYRVLNELYPLLEFLKYGYNDRVQLYLKLPRKPCNPTILDFREGVPDVATMIEKNKQDR